MNVEVVEAAVSRTFGSGSLQCTTGHSATCQVLPSLRQHEHKVRYFPKKSCCAQDTCCFWHQCDYCALPQDADLSFIAQPCVDALYHHAVEDSLDSILHARGWSHPCAMKIDVEGSELEVVQGI